MGKVPKTCATYVVRGSQPQMHKKETSVTYVVKDLQSHMIALNLHKKELPLW